jgi:Domain of unknown function (DUF5655)
MAHTISEHFVERSSHVREIYDLLVSVAREFGPVEEDPKKTSIHLNRKSAFAGVATQRESLILTVKATTALDDSRIRKSEQASANRWYHYIKISDPAEIDASLIGWLKDSYKISG